MQQMYGMSRHKCFMLGISWNSYLSTFGVIGLVAPSYINAERPSKIGTRWALSGTETWQKASRCLIGKIVYTWQFCIAMFEYQRAHGKENISSVFFNPWVVTCKNKSLADHRQVTFPQSPPASQDCEFANPFLQLRAQFGNKNQPRNAD